MLFDFDWFIAAFTGKSKKYEVKIVAGTRSNFK